MNLQDMIAGQWPEQASWAEHVHRTRRKITRELLADQAQQIEVPQSRLRMSCGCESTTTPTSRS